MIGEKILLEAYILDHLCLYYFYEIECVAAASAKGVVQEKGHLEAEIWARNRMYEIVNGKIDVYRRVWKGFLSTNECLKVERCLMHLATR